MSDEATPESVDGSPQIKLTLPTTVAAAATAPIKSLFSRSPSPSPTQKRKQLLPEPLDATKSKSLLNKCDTQTPNTGSATGNLIYYFCYHSLPMNFISVSHRVNKKSVDKNKENETKLMVYLNVYNCK